MNLVNFVKKNTSREYSAMANEVEFSRTLKKLSENSDIVINSVVIDDFLVENWKFIVENEEWEDEFCRRLKNRKEYGIKIL